VVSDWNTRAQSAPAECEFHGDDFEACEIYGCTSCAPAEVAQGEAIHQWEFADAWMDTDEAGAARARCEGYKTRIVYTATQHDAELVRQCIAEELASWTGDFRGPVSRALHDLQDRIDAKLASLRN
jgi:hypothetical protein